MAVSPNMIIRKCKQAGLSFWTSSQAAIELKDKIDAKMSDRDINRRVANSLRLIDENAANQFESYHSIEVRTSKSTLETFNRKKITKSLMTETRIPKNIAEEIAYSVENEIRRLQMKSISSALVREMVNTALLERKLVNAQANYTRVGLPVYDIKKIIEKRKVTSPSALNELFGNEVLQEFTLQKLLTRDVTEAYLDSDIYIHALDRFGTSPYSLQNDMRYFLKNGLKLPNSITTGPAKKLDVAAYHAVRLMINTRRFAARGSGFDFFNIFLAPYVRGRSNSEIEQACQSFLYELNSAPAFDNIFTVNMDTTIPAFLKDEPAIGSGGKAVGVYGDYEKESQKFMSIFLQTMHKGDYTSNAFKWPNICIKHRGDINEKLPYPRPCYFIRQTDKNQSLAFNDVLTGRDSTTLRAGIMQTISLNLPKIAKLNKDEKSFYDGIESKLGLIKDTMLLKREIIKERLYENQMLPLLTQFYDGTEYVKLDEFRYQVVLTGLPQAAKIHLNTEKYDKECLELSKKVIRFAQRKFREYKKDEDLQMQLADYPDTEALTRFTAENKRLGIEMDVSSIQSEGMDEEELLNVFRQTQPLLDGGSFLETSSKNILQDKEIIFVKLF